MRPPTLPEIERAAELLRGAIARTPLVPLADVPGVLLKVETLQPTGSFKVRGVHHAVVRLPDEARRRGLRTVSAGNTAQALAWSARRHGVVARSVMPDTAPRAKIEAVRALGGEPVLVPRDELFRYLRERGWRADPEAFVHPWIDRDVAIGHGTLGLEIAQDAPEATRVIVPVGGGGLLAGVGSALRALLPGARIVAVEPAGCPKLRTSIEAGRASAVECRTACDGVAVPYVTEELFPLLRSLADEVALVSEDEVFAAMRLLALRAKLVVEPAGALAVAAALRTGGAAGAGPTVALVTGGSVDPALLARILDAERRPEGTSPA